MLACAVLNVFRLDNNNNNKIQIPAGRVEMLPGSVNNLLKTYHCSCSHILWQIMKVVREVHSLYILSNTSLYCLGRTVFPSFPVLLQESEVMLLSSYSSPRTSALSCPTHFSVNLFVVHLPSSRTIFGISWFSSLLTWHFLPLISQPAPSTTIWHLHMQFTICLPTPFCVPDLPDSCT